MHDGERSAEEQQQLSAGHRECAQEKGLAAREQRSSSRQARENPREAKAPAEDRPLNTQARDSPGVEAVACEEHEHGDCQREIQRQATFQRVLAASGHEQASEAVKAVDFGEHLSAAG